MKRVVLLGPGAAGKSTFARRLGAATGLPIVELDEHFWRPGLVATPGEEWIEVQERLAAAAAWIMDGDLGPYDVLEVRLRAADTVVLLDLSTRVCAWRALRRSRERADFWRWLLTWRRRYRPLLLRAIAEHASEASLYRPTSQRQVDRLVEQLAERSRG